MGSRFEITVVANDSAQANEYIDLAVVEITRIENLISSRDPNSQNSEIKNPHFQSNKNISKELAEKFTSEKVSILICSIVDSYSVKPIKAQIENQTKKRVTFI